MRLMLSSQETRKRKEKIPLKASSSALQTDPMILHLVPLQALSAFLNNLILHVMLISCLCEDEQGLLGNSWFRKFKV